MPIIYVDNFDEWREKARDLLIQKVLPHEVQWFDAHTPQQPLFKQEKLINPVSTAVNSAKFMISREFITLAKTVACHRSEQKWVLLYTALWRLSHGEKHLLQLSTDPIVHTLLLMYKSVRRDVHKMKAFVRFKLYEKNDQQLYIAWHKPDHKILKLVGSFFQRRFGVMYWIIVTPDGALFWDREHLHFDENITQLHEPLLDEVEDLWRTYYRSIFNPARIKINAMKREMPVRHWKTLPETSIIPAMLQEAPQRVATMLKYTEGLEISAENFIPDEKSLSSFRKAAQQCQGCMLHKNATQAVFGIGPSNARLMLIGEQPGDQEDQQGMPFIGPAGQVLNQILTAVGINRDDVYLTNAVKHFKHKLSNHRRFHVSPNVREMMACKPWLVAEIDIINPSYIICLGVIAARALISQGFHMKEEHGKWQSFSDTQQIMATYHPSAVLRAATELQQQEIYQYLLTDIRSAVSFLDN